MITDKTFILLDEKNKQHALICKVIRIVKDKYNEKFRVCDLTSLEEFTIYEKKLLNKIFAPGITRLHAWEHHFYLIENFWHYDESIHHDYRIMINQIMLLLNRGEIPVGGTIKTKDYQFIKSLFYNWCNLLDPGVQKLWEINFDERDFILFMSYNLKNRLGDMSIYNFEFLKTFMEAKEDYHYKKIVEAVFGIDSYRE